MMRYPTLPRSPVDGSTTTRPRPEKIATVLGGTLMMLLLTIPTAAASTISRPRTASTTKIKSMPFPLPLVPRVGAGSDPERRRLDHDEAPERLDDPYARPGRDRL